LALNQKESDDGNAWIPLLIWVRITQRMDQSGIRGQKILVSYIWASEQYGTVGHFAEEYTFHLV
jgi:hypothetical protein